MSHVPPVLVRPLRPGEQEQVQQVFAALSPESRFLRFHTPLPRLTPGLVSTLAEVRPGVKHGWLALAGDRAVGLGQWVRLAEQPRMADASLTVADDHQGRGIGTRLLAALAHDAGGQGIESLSCWVHPANTPVERLLARLGARPGSGGRDERLVAVEDVLARLAVPAAAPGIVVPWPRGVGRPRTAAS